MLTRQSPKASTELARKNRSGFIDSLRGISILLVVLYHGDDLFTVQASTLAPLLPSQLTRTLFQNGYYGVTVFFVISGFLITRISLSRYGALSAIRPGNFLSVPIWSNRTVPLSRLIVLLGLHFAHVRDFVYDAEILERTDK
jgi:peptidoglycan/LPS O-acetylase OafA/YrhL